MRARPKMKPAAAVSEPAGDPLADALLFLAAHHGRAISREALLAGLPILDGRLPPPLFERAATKAGLEAKALRRRLSEIPALVLPAVLSMRDGSTRILLAIDLDTKIATVVDPSTNTAPQSRSLNELSDEYLGFAFFVRPTAAADARAVAAGDLPHAHWFWSVVRRFWSNYSHVATAALIVNMLALASPLFIMNVYDRVVPNGAIPSLVALSIGMCIAVVFDFVLRMVRSRIIDMTGKKLDVVLASNIFEHVLSIKMAQRPASVGILANQMREFDSVREFFTSGTVVSVTDLMDSPAYAADYDCGRLLHSVAARTRHAQTPGRSRRPSRRSC
jgi:ATP-binding cassette subfamily C protein LapB